MLVATLANSQRARHGLRQRVHVRAQQERGVLAVLVSVAGHLQDSQSEVCRGEQLPVRVWRLLRDQTRDVQQVLQIRPAQRPVDRNRVHEREAAVFHAGRLGRLHCGRGRRLRQHRKLLRHISHKIAHRVLLDLKGHVDEFRGQRGARAEVAGRVRLQKGLRARQEGVHRGRKAHHKEQSVTVVFHSRPGDERDNCVRAAVDDPLQSERLLRLCSGSDYFVRWRG